VATDRLLREAVRDGGRRGHWGDRLDDLFALLFRGLVYAQIWEDPELDVEALALGPGQRVVTIASGGCNALSYLLSNPQEVVAVDLNHAHVALTRLKRAAALELPSHADFFAFFGDGADPGNPARFDNYLRERLDPATRAYWQGRGPCGRRRIRAFVSGIHRQGLLGRFLALLHLVLRLHGKDPRRLLAARDPEEQRQLFAEILAPVLQGRLVRHACRLPVALYGLGIPPAQYRALADCAAGDLPALLQRRVERLACAYPPGENYFAWQAFARRYPPADEGPLPPYLRPQAWPALPRRAGRLEVHHASVTEYLAEQPPASVDRYVLLDAQDWMSPSQLARLWREIARTARPGARVLFRTGGEASPVDAVLPERERARWAHDPVAAVARAERDRAGVYGGVHVYERVAV